MARPRHPRPHGGREHRHRERQPERCRVRRVDRRAGGHAARRGPSKTSSPSGRRTAAPSRRTRRCSARPPASGCTTRARTSTTSDRRSARPVRVTPTPSRSGSSGAPTCSRAGSTARACRDSSSRPTAAARPSAPASRAPTVRVDRFELIRAMTGRRSVAQMEAYGWDGPPQAADLVLAIFTPRAADFVE